jgi:hypothetical protein
MRLSDYHDWSAIHNPPAGTQAQPQQPTQHPGAPAQDQHQHHHSGSVVTTAVKVRANYSETIVSPPHGADALLFGLPLAIHDISTSGSDSSEASQRRANNSTGSLKVDEVKINLDEETMSEGGTDDLINPEVYDEEMT